jgi:hypothetical protein
MNESRKISMIKFLGTASAPVDIDRVIKAARRLIEICDETEADKSHFAPTISGAFSRTGILGELRVALAILDSREE